MLLCLTAVRGAPQRDCAPLLILTQRRSGTRWLCDSIHESFQRASVRVMHIEESRTRAAAKAQLWPPRMNDTGHSAKLCITATKFLVTPDSFEEVAPLLDDMCRRGGAAITFWRRNALRRLVSCEAHIATKGALGEAATHPHSDVRHSSRGVIFVCASSRVGCPHPPCANAFQAEAKVALKAHKAHVERHSVLRWIKRDLALRADVETVVAAALRPTNCTLRWLGRFEYEALVEGSAWHALFEALELPANASYSGTTELKVIHNSVPLESTVDDFSSIEHTLSKTPYAWMLRDDVSRRLARGEVGLSSGDRRHTLASPPSPIEHDPRLKPVC